MGSNLIHRAQKSDLPQSCHKYHFKLLVPEQITSLLYFPGVLFAALVPKEIIHLRVFSEPKENTVFPRPLTIYRSVLGNGDLYTAFVPYWNPCVAYVAMLNKGINFTPFSVKCIIRLPLCLIILNQLISQLNCFKEKQNHGLQFLVHFYWDQQLTNYMVASNLY